MVVWACDLDSLDLLLLRTTLEVLGEIGREGAKANTHIWQLLGHHLRQEIDQRIQQRPVRAISQRKIDRGLLATRATVGHKGPGFVSDTLNVYFLLRCIETVDTFAE